MRFKSVISKQNLSILNGIVLALEKISNNAVIFLSPDHMRIALVTDNIDLPKAFVELRQDIMFAEYHIESLNDNNLLLKINLNNFSNALASGKNANQSVMKLVKRGETPCLCIETKAKESLGVDITHDIPISVLRCSEIVHYQPPNVPPPRVSLEIGRNKLFRTVIERMQKLSKYLYFQAFQAGKIILSIDHVSNSTIKTHFTGLVPRFRGGTLSRQRDDTNEAMVKCDIRKLSATLHFQSHYPWSAAIAHVSNNEILVLNVELTPSDLGNVTYFVPVIIMNDFEAGEEEEAEETEEAEEAEDHGQNGGHDDEYGGASAGSYADQDHSCNY
mgnify:CR=1 FL=1